MHRIVTCGGVIKGGLPCRLASIHYFLQVRMSVAVAPMTIIHTFQASSGG